MPYEKLEPADYPALVIEGHVYRMVGINFSPHKFWSTPVQAIQHCVDYWHSSEASFTAMETESLAKSTQRLTLLPRHSWYWMLMSTDIHHDAATVIYLEQVV